MLKLTSLNNFVFNILQAYILRDKYCVQVKMLQYSLGLYLWKEWTPIFLFENTFMHNHRDYKKNIIILKSLCA